MEENIFIIDRRYFVKVLESETSKIFAKLTIISSYLNEHKNGMLFMKSCLDPVYIEFDKTQEELNEIKREILKIESKLWKA